MAQLVNVSATNPNHLSLILDSTWWKERINCQKWSFVLQTHQINIKIIIMYFHFRSLPRDSGSLTDNAIKNMGKYGGKYSRNFHWLT